MRIDILTVLPELLESPLNHSIVKRAQDKGLVEIEVHNLRSSLGHHQVGCTSLMARRVVLID